MASLSMIVVLANTWGLYYRTLQIRNLWKMDIFHSNLVSFT